MNKTNSLLSTISFNLKIEIFKEIRLTLIVSLAVSMVSLALSMTILNANVIYYILKPNFD